MKLIEVEDETVDAGIPVGQWNFDQTALGDDVDWADVYQVTSLAHPSVQLRYTDLDHHLDEATHRELMSLIDPNFLRQGQRAAALRKVDLANPPFRNDTMIFRVPSGTHRDIVYFPRVKFMQWGDVVADGGLNAVEAARLLFWASDLRLHCTCPSFLYWGYQWILSVLDSAIYPEERPPVIRNPRHRGIVCKHLNRTMKSLAMRLGAIAAEIRRQRAAAAVD